MSAPADSAEGRWITTMTKDEFMRRANNLSLLQGEVDALFGELERLRGDLARCREVQKATAEGWRHEVAEVAAIVGAPAHTAELAACVRAEVERLMRERDEAKEHARLAEMIAARAERGAT